MNTAPAPATSAPVENMAGLVERVTIHNEKDGFCVLRMTQGKRLVVLVGQRRATATAARNGGQRRRWPKLGECLSAA